MAHAGPADVAAPKTGIAIVDFDRLLLEVGQGRRVTDQMEDERRLRAEAIAKRQARVDELKPFMVCMYKEQCETYAAEYQRRWAALNDENRALEKLGELELALRAPIERRLKELLAIVAEREGYVFIFARREVLFARKQLDITDKIIEEYDRLHPKYGEQGAAIVTPALKVGDAPKPTKP
jgi:Skp family chaperone for outer membrane proteins